MQSAVVSNSITLSSSDVYSSSFSPDNTRLYNATDDSLFQYNLLAGTPVDIINSKTTIYSGSIGTFMNAIQNAPDGKIYTVRWFNTGDSLGVINNPNALGLACNFNFNGIYLGGRYCTNGLPNFIEDYFNETETSVQETVNHSDLIIHPNPTTGIFTVQGSTGEIDVYDLFGRLVLRSNKEVIDMSSYPAGIYLVKAGEAVRKVILN